MKVLYSELVSSGGHSSVSNQASTFLSLQSASLAESIWGIMEYGIVVLSFCWFTSGVSIVVAGSEVTYSAIGRDKIV
jgi:hypothetical protein